MSNNTLNTKFVTPVIRLSYPRLGEPDPERGNKYSISVPLPKSETQAVATLKECMKNAAINTWGPKAASLAGIKSFVTDCDTDPKYADDEVYSGCLKFSAKASRRPGCVWQNLQPVPQEQIADVFYAGCWIRASITAYGTETGGSRTVAFRLNNVMFVKDGEMLGSASSPEDDFAGYADPNWMPQQAEPAEPDFF